MTTDALPLLIPVALALFLLWLEWRGKEWGD